MGESGFFGLGYRRYLIYRNILANISAKGFQDQNVYPIEIPTKEQIEVEPFDGDKIPHMVLPKNFPATEHADDRKKRIKTQAFLLPIVRLIAGTNAGPVSADIEEFLNQVYPEPLENAWPRAPVIAPELKAEDMFAALAVSGPFAMFLKKDKAGDYVMDVEFMEKYPVKKGLLTPGGVATFDVVGGKLKTRHITYQGASHSLSDGTYGYERASKAFLCGINTLLTTLLHNCTFHLVYVTSMVVSSTNELNPNHPIRRLLHPGAQTALIGNYEVGTLQVKGKHGFSTRLFSHEYDTLCTMINDYISDFKIAHLDPEFGFAQRGLKDAAFALPYWDDELALWKINKNYVQDYVNHFYPNDGSVSSDKELRRFLDSLDRLLPAGLYDDVGYLPQGMDLTREKLIRICATFLHISSSTHDTVNNDVWDYSVHNAIVPTMVPNSLQAQDIVYSFDFLNTIIGTWKPYNMLFDGVSVLALDDKAKTIMDDYVEALRERQTVMEREGPRTPGRIYPKELNPSVSN